MTSKLELLSAFGFTRDPFAAADMESADATRVRNILGMAVNARAQVAIVGERGIGKTRSVAAALRKLKCKVVRVLSADKARLTANDIQGAMILDLSDETPKLAREVRIRQVRRILGEASRKQAVVVVIEESHRLHSQTLRSIKNLRELEWMGESQLFSVVLIGQSDCTQRSGLSEVRLRTETVHMHGLTRTEVADYIASTLGEVYPKDSVAAVAGIQDARNYLDLQEILMAGMERAMAEGRSVVTPADVEACVRGSGRISDSAQQTPPKDHARGNDALRTVISRRRQESAEAAPAQVRSVK